MAKKTKAAKTPTPTPISTPTTRTPTRATRKGTTRVARPSLAAKATGPAKTRRAGAKATPAKAAPGAPGKRRGALDAAAFVLARVKKPMNVKDIVESMAVTGLWKSPGGKTPAATLYAAVHREIKAKGRAARFRKVEQGMFEATGR